jgi:hypothetical protein
MLEEVETSVSATPVRKKKKRGRLLYSTPMELSRSRMRRSNVVSRFKSNHGDTSRTLGFQRMDIEDSACKSSYIRPILKEVVEATAGTEVDVDEDSLDQVSPKLQVAFSDL